MNETTKPTWMPGDNVCSYHARLDAWRKATGWNSDRDDAAVDVDNSDTITEVACH